ncbi:hypothetical protein Trydic_g7211 [Trypoxylus dichotomus]
MLDHNSATIRLVWFRISQIFYLFDVLENEIDERQRAEVGRTMPWTPANYLFPSGVCMSTLKTDVYDDETSYWHFGFKILEAQY